LKPPPTSSGMGLLSKCSELNRGAFSTFVLYRPITGRLTKFPCQLMPKN
jgi:hypothetical protein